MATKHWKFVFESQHLNGCVPFSAGEEISEEFDEVGSVPVVSPYSWTGPESGFSPIHKTLPGRKFALSCWLQPASKITHCQGY